MGLAVARGARSAEMRLLPWPGASAQGCRRVRREAVVRQTRCRTRHQGIGLLPWTVPHTHPLMRAKPRRGSENGFVPNLPFNPPGSETALLAKLLGTKADERWRDDEAL